LTDDASSLRPVGSTQPHSKGLCPRGDKISRGTICTQVVESWMLQYYYCCCCCCCVPDVIDDFRFDIANTITLLVSLNIGIIVPTIREIYYSSCAILGMQFFVKYIYSVFFLTHLNWIITNAVTVLDSM
jgi:hypothetical protein